MAPSTVEEERAPFLEPADRTNSDPPLDARLEGDDSLNTSGNGTWSLERSTRRLYVSHFLSTCNSRVFEFGSVLYLAAIFPGTLLPMSVYALGRGAAAILLSSLVGQYIDRGNRLKVVRLSIVSQRMAVAVSCVIFYILAKMQDIPQFLRIGLLVMLIIMACIEKLAAIMNLVSVERDWVVVVANDDMVALRAMNSQMRRIDLVCKLFGPFFIALVDGTSTETAILVNLGMNCVSVVIEYFSIAKVYYHVPELQRVKAAPYNTQEHAETGDGLLRRRWEALKLTTSKAGKDLILYFKHTAFMPSFACALLYFTVLSFSGQMVTYLLSTGYTSTQIGIARTISVAFEVLATWAGPWLMSRIGPIRAGLWFASWQVGCLALGMSIFWSYADNALISASALVGSTILSRVGLWGFDLSAQIIVQEEVEAENRGAFSAVEASWQNVFEMCSYTATIILSSPDQFQYPATFSVGAVLCAWALYSRFVRVRRGHLCHLPACISHSEKRQRSTEDLFEGVSRGHRDTF
ncbi:Fc.00g089620.m01.CDS01 [Cosmosporella sp. VM-42]